VPTTGIAPGSLIAGYRIEEMAGRGGMGVVYRATQLGLGRTVALKLIAPDLADDARFRERFKRESRLAASIDHPNVIPVYEAGETNGDLFISMRWVEGTDLGTLIKRGGGLDPKRASEIITQVAAALDAAHERGLVHRDVKPANVLITAGRDEHVYLSDFGLVKRITGSGDVTRSGEVVGTLDYIAPERIAGKGSDAGTDVYSLGCVLFHCLSGRVPFETDSEIAKIYAHLNERPPRLSELVPELPERLDRVVARAMSKEREERYPSAGDLSRAATTALKEMPSSNGEPSRARRARTAVLSDAPTRRRGTRRGDRRALLAGLAALALGGIAAGVLALAGVFEDGSGERRSGASAAVPPDGTFLRARGSPRVHVVKAGAKFVLPRRERTGFGYERRKVRVVSRAALRGVPTIPRTGSLVSSYSNSLVWEVRGGERRLTGAPKGADVATIPSSGLRQIPLTPGRRKTSLVVEAPASVQERSSFHLIARVRSAKGVPTGACLFFRIGANGLKERANTSTRRGRCDAVVDFSGARSVRYLVRFYGDAKWKSSEATTPPIDVQPR
jgi:Protein kinase domain